MSSTSLLLADDSPTIAKILQMALASEAYQIRSVLTAEDAIRELKANPPVLFLVDLSLPGKNGYEFARLIRADAKLRQIRVVLLASAFEPVDEGELASCGADGVVKKPFDPAELRLRLREIQVSPPKFPEGAHVTGSLSGFMVADPHQSTRTNLTIGGMSAASLTDTNPGFSPPSESDPLAGLLGEREAPAPPGADADAILANLLGDAPAPLPKAPASAEGPPPFSHRGGPNPATIPSAEEQREPTVAIDLHAQGLGDVLDLSGSFTGSTPAGGSSVIELNTHTVNMASAGGPPATAPSVPAPAPKAAPKAAPEKVPPAFSKPVPPSQAAPAPPGGGAPLSANAQALAAFFEAELSAKSPPEAPPAPQEPEDAFDASLGSIDWGSGPAETSLNQWSSAGAAKAAAPKAPPPPSLSVQAPTVTPPPFSAPRKSGTRTDVSTPGFAPAPSGSGVTAGQPSGSMLFDTGGSTFRFSEDYVNRITKSFTGEPHEAVPEKHAMFPQQSDDRPVAAAAPAAPSAEAPAQGAGGGAWSEKDVAMIEKVVREEVQMVVREVAEKIAWEVIPELAENLIRKELERVLKDMGQ